MNNSKTVDESIIPNLIAQLRSKNLSIAINAARSLGILGPKAVKAVSHLVIATSHPNTELREQACASIGRIAENPILAIPTLAKALNDKKTSVRRYAAASLVEFRSEVTPFASQLYKSLRDSDEHVREFIISSIENMDEVIKDLSVIQEKRYDSNSFVRSAAERILNKHKKLQFDVA